MSIKSTEITTSGSSIFVCPADEEHAITCMIFCNDNITTDLLLSIRLVKSGDNTTTSPNKIISNLSIPHGETFTFDSERIVLDGGDYVHATADNTGLMATVSTIRVS